ncbi:hypothetical protein, partial [Nocardia seriolae]
HPATLQPDTASELTIQDTSVSGALRSARQMPCNADVGVRIDPDVYTERNTDSTEAESIRWC